MLTRIEEKRIESIKVTVTTMEVDIGRGLKIEDNAIKRSRPIHPSINRCRSMCPFKKNERTRPWEKNEIE